MKVCWVCLSSSSNVISELSRYCSERLGAYDELFFFGTKYSISESVDRARVAEVSYGKSFSGVLALASSITRLRRFVIRNEIKSVFIFSTLPIYGLLFLALPRDREIMLWLHDPVPHLGERRVFSGIKLINDYIFSKLKHKKSIILGAEALRAQLSGTVFNEVATQVISFPAAPDLVQVQSPLEKKPQVVFFGRIEEYKGLDSFFNALISHGADLKHRLKFLIAGKGSLPPSCLQAQTAGFDIEVRNSFIPSCELNELIRGSKIAIFPYLEATATLALQSAGTLGCLIVATSVGALPSSVIPEYSIICEPNDPKALMSAVRSLAASDSSPVEISESYKERFDPDIFPEQILAHLSGME